MLNACLNYHARFFKHVVVLDGKSTDGTADVARNHQTVLISRPFSGSFADERNFLSEHAPTAWVLHVDCDELFNWQLLETLDKKVLTQALTTIDAYKIKRLNIEPKDPNPETYEIRFYDKTKCQWKGDYHEILVDIKTQEPIDSIKDRTLTLDNEPIIHALKHEKARIDTWTRWDVATTASKKVLVATLVKDQARWLPRFLEALDRIDYPQEMLRFVFLEGGSEDASFQMLHRWAEGRRNVTVRPYYLLPGDRFERLAHLRNALIDQYLKDEDYVFWIDSDILVGAKALRQLLSDSVPIVAPMVMIENTETFYDTLAFRKNGEKFTPGHPYFAALTLGITQVDSVGGCYLVDASAYKAGARYTGGDSENVGFCLSAKEKGFLSYLDMELRVQHINLEKYGVAWH